MIHRYFLSLWLANARSKQQNIDNPNFLVSELKSALVDLWNLNGNHAHEISARNSIKIVRYHDFSLEHFCMLIRCPLSLSIPVKPLRSKSIPSMRGSCKTCKERERKGKKRRENSLRQQNFRHERGKERELLATEKFPSREGRRGREREKRERGERKTFLLPLLLAMEATSVARRRKKRGEGRCRGREKRERGEEEEREAFLPASPRDGISVARERARGRERNREKKEKLRKRSSPYGSLVMEVISVAMRREERERREGESERGYWRERHTREKKEFSLQLPLDGSNFHRQETRGERRRREWEGGEENFCDENKFGREKREREREKESSGEREEGSKREGNRERKSPSPRSTHTRAQGRGEREKERNLLLLSLTRTSAHTQEREEMKGRRKNAGERERGRERRRNGRGRKRNHGREGGRKNERERKRNRGRERRERERFSLLFFSFSIFPFF